MKGKVDKAGCALIGVELTNGMGSTRAMSAWIDTGFTGDLVIPQSVVDELDLTLTGTVSATLADGSKTTMVTYRCFIEWFGQRRQLEVVANEGTYALLGVGMLLDRDLFISYGSTELSLD